MSRASELAAELEGRIAAGELQPGARLEPIRAVARSRNLAPATVAAAYRILAHRGLVVARGRDGTRVAERPTLPLRPEPPIPPGLTDLASGNPDPELLPDLVPHLAAAASAVGLYGEDPLHPDLVAAVTRLLADERVPGHRPVAVSGALDGVERVLAAHLRPGDRVVVEDPGYPAVTDLVIAAGYRPVPLPVDEEGLVPARLERALKGAAAVLLTPRAQNPTGAAVGARRAAELAAVLEQAPDLLVIEDDHAALIAGAPLSAVSPQRRRWAFIQSASKALGPDLRLAWIVGDPLTIDRVEGRQRVGPGWVSRLLQAVVASLLADPGVRQRLQQAAEAYRQRREAMRAALVAEGFEANAASGLNIWVPVPDEQAAVAGLAQAGYAARAGSAFRQTAGPAVRLTISRLAPEEAPAVAAALAAVATRPTPRGA